MTGTAELPGWANWLAQDADGSWWAYEAEPHQQTSGWYENEVGRNMKISQQQPNRQWQSSLRRVAKRPATDG